MTEPLPPYTALEVSDLCRVSVWTVGEWVRTGVLPRLPTRRLRIPRAAVHALLEGYYAGHGEPHWTSSPKAPAPRRRNRGAAQGSLEKAPLGGSDRLHRPIGPAPGDVVVRVVEGRDAAARINEAIG